MNELRHFLQFNDFSKDDFDYLFSRAKVIKDRFKRYVRHMPLQDRTLVMVFEKASTRTRLSFEAGMHQLGGAAIYLNTRDTQLGRGEPVEDSAQVISRMCDLVMIRTFEQTMVEKFAAKSRVPVINGLTNEYHPCQILADIFTYIEHRLHQCLQHLAAGRRSARLSGPCVDTPGLRGRARAGRSVFKWPL